MTFFKPDNFENADWFVQIPYTDDDKSKYAHVSVWGNLNDLMSLDWKSVFNDAINDFGSEYIELAVHVPEQFMVRLDNENDARTQSAEIFIKWKHLSWDEEHKNGFG